MMVGDGSGYDCCNRLQGDVDVQNYADCCCSGGVDWKVELRLDLVRGCDGDIRVECDRFCHSSDKRWQMQYRHVVDGDVGSLYVLGGCSVGGAQVGSHRELTCDVEYERW